MNVGYWFRTAVRFLRRSGRATWTLGLMLSLSVAALVFLTATAEGVNTAMIENSVGLFSGHITAGPLPVSLSPADLQAPGVAAVLKRRYAQGLRLNGPRAAAAQLVQIEPQREAQSAALFKSFTVLPKPGEIVIGRALAHSLGLEAGDKLTFAAGLDSPRQTYRLAGTYATGIEHIDASCAFTASRATGGPWFAAIFLKPTADQAALLDTYRSRWPGLRFTPWQSQMPDLKQLVDLNYVSMNLVIGMVFAVVGVGCGAAFVIFILKNLREYGLLRAMGAGGFETGLLIWAQILLLNLIAALSGLALGCLLSWLTARHGIDLTAFTSHNRYFAVSGVIRPRLTAYAVLAPPLCALGLSLLAGLWPAAMVARKPSSELIRGLTR